MSKQNNKTIKVLLFSTRFLEEENKLFNQQNYEVKQCSNGNYYSFFFSHKLPKKVLDILNEIYNRTFFHDFCCNNNLVDENGDELINGKDDLDIIKNKLWNIYKGKVRTSKWENFWGRLEDANSESYVLRENESSKDEDCPFVKDDVERETDSETYIRVIKEIEQKSENKGESFNTDFGSSVAEDKKTIDRRFKIYKLKTNKKDNIHSYGVWCLGRPSNEVKWYEALYGELKDQMGEDFNEVKEILFFLHDGDIGEKIPFRVMHYKAKKDTFGFLDEKITLSVAIFQHSLSPIATALSYSDIDKALRLVQEAMERGGELAFLNEISDYVASWPNGGKEKYIEAVSDPEDIKTKFGIDSLITDKNKEITNETMKVEDVYREIKKIIDGMQ